MLFVMSWFRASALALLSLTVAPARRAAPREEPLPRVDLKLPAALGPKWIPRTAHLTASRVRLNGLGAATHANWVLFRLPFDASDTSRLHNVFFTVASHAPTDVGAIALGSVCVAVPSSGPVDQWALYTTSGVGWTQRFGWHGAPPTDDPTVLGINVPTRVANYVACGRDGGKLVDPGDWSLDVSWSER